MKTIYRELAYHRPPANYTITVDNGDLYVRVTLAPTTGTGTPRRITKAKISPISEDHVRVVRVVSYTSRTHSWSEPLEFRGQDFAKAFYRWLADVIAADAAPPPPPPAAPPPPAELASSPPPEPASSPPAAPQDDGRLSQDGGAMTAGDASES